MINVDLFNPRRDIYLSWLIFIQSVRINYALQTRRAIETKLNQKSLSKILPTQEQASYNNVEILLNQSKFLSYFLGKRTLELTFEEIKTLTENVFACFTKHSQVVQRIITPLPCPLHSVSKSWICPSAIASFAIISAYIWRRRSATEFISK